MVYKDFKEDLEGLRQNKLIKEEGNRKDIKCRRPQYIKINEFGDATLLTDIISYDKNKISSLDH